MGVYIRDMSKPKDCEECKFCIVEAKVEGKIYPLNAYCFVQHQNLKDFDECPLIEIPTPHGRLIDADLFKELIKDSVPSWTIGVKIPTYGDMDIMDKIYFMPTFLEAEE